jgi:hypothetical protein
MGTDIHMACEVRRNGKWELVKDRVFKNPWYRPDSEYSWAQEEYTNIPYDNRCYNLFAILADVRNGRGFAGCKIGEFFNPISYPKGYPEDMCDELRGDIDYYDYDDRAGFLSNEHSASWLTLKELLDYDWDQMHRNYGCVCENTYRDFVMKGLHPNSWSGGVGGSSIVHLSETEMVDLIQGRYPREEGKQYYTECYFIAETYKDASGGFYEDVIPVLKTLVPDGGTTEDVRLVFDFDS